MTVVCKRLSRSELKLSPYMDQGRLNALQARLCARLDPLLGELGVSLYRTRKLYYGCCPVHGGNNPGALNLYPEGETRPGYWRCHTKGCERHFRRTIIGFVRGVLSRQRHDWTWLADPTRRAGQKTVDWKETVDWCCRFLDTDIRKIEVDYGELEKQQFVAGMARFVRQPSGQQEGVGLTRTDVRRHLAVPSGYFLGRGFSAQVLDRFDVGDYPAAGRPLSDRAVAPVYDRTHKFVVGFTGRSVLPRCGKCERWHRPAERCPDRDDLAAWGRTAKWFNHKLDRDAHLYGYWSAEKPIRDTGVVALVEGPGDVWRLSEAGIHNAVSLFGASLSDEQQVLLEMSGAMDVVVLMDMDKAGQAARDELRQRLQRSFRLHFPELKTKDIGDMTVVQVRADILPLLEELSRRRR
jgi:5S rRNA maturation endonuclease (ribonuclease M5)